MSRTSVGILIVSILLLVIGAFGEARTLEGLLTTWSGPDGELYDLAVRFDGSIWLAVGGRLYAFEPDDGSFTAFIPSLGGVTPSFRMVAPDTAGHLWLSDEAGERIVRFDPTTHSFTAWQIPHPPFASPSTPFGVTPGPDGGIWFTTHYNDYGIGRLDPESGAFSRYESPGGTSRGMPVEIAFDSGGVAWFTLDSHYGEPGLGRLDPATGAIASWLNPYTGAMAPFGIVVRSGTIWFADHSRSSIVRFDPVTEAFTLFPAPADLTDAHFLTPGRDGRLYTAAFASCSVGAFDPASGQFEIRRLHHPECEPMGVTTAPTGQIWVAVLPPYGSVDSWVSRLTPFGPSALAIGAPGEDVGGAESAGAANVLYGSDEGLSGEDGQLWHQDATGVGGTAEDFDRFGYSLASADFNGDSVLDLAVGSPTETVGTVVSAGAVNVLYGFAFGGITGTGSLFLHQESPGMDGYAEQGDQLGWSLTAGDYNGDGFGDLVIGIPFEDVGTVVDAGCISIVYGSPSGLDPTTNHLLHQDSAGIDGTAEAQDGFGYSLATGDFDRDGRDDLVVGVPWESVGSAYHAGAVHVIPGTAAGLTGDGERMWHQDSPSVLGLAEPDDQFGFGLAVGDFDGDGWPDLAIGANGETVNAVVEAGAVNVLYGSQTGLTTTSQDYWHQDLSSIEDGCDAGDAFGQALAGADFDGDGYDDLAIGIPFECFPGVTWAGAVAVLYGSSSGLTGDRDQLWHQDSPGITSSTAENWDKFGFRVAAADFDFDGFDDLAVGVPEEDIGTVTDAGAVNVLYGKAGGLSSDREELWHQGRSDVVDSAEADDRFGWGLSPLHLTLRHLYVILIFRDGFESGDLSAWSSWQ